MINYKSKEISLFIMTCINSFIFLILICLILPINANSQNQQVDNIPTLTYEQLIQNKQQYLGEIVRVKANYVWGFEWQFLCGKDCKTLRRETWVEFGELCKDSNRKTKKGNDKYIDNKAEVVYVGILSEGNFGHLNGYKHQFNVSCVEKFKLVKPN